MIFVDEQTLVSLCKKQVFFILTCSIMTLFQNKKITLNFNQFLTFDSREKSTSRGLATIWCRVIDQQKTLRRADLVQACVYQHCHSTFASVQ